MTRTGASASSTTTTSGAPARIEGAQVAPAEHVRGRRRRRERRVLERHAGPRRRSARRRAGGRHHPRSRRRPRGRRPVRLDDPGDPVGHADGHRPQAVVAVGHPGRAPRPSRTRPTPDRRGRAPPAPCRRRGACRRPRNRRQLARAAAARHAATGPGSRWCSGRMRTGASPQGDPTAPPDASRSNARSTAASTCAPPTHRCGEADGRAPASTSTCGQHVHTRVRRPRAVRDPRDLGGDRHGDEVPARRRGDLRDQRRVAGLHVRGVLGAAAVGGQGTALGGCDDLPRVGEVGEHGDLVRAARRAVR